MMKSIVNRIVVVVMVGALASVAAFGKTHKQRGVTFDSDIKVNGTLVKKGSYDLTFDDESGELTISKNGKTVAQTMTKLEARAKKANGFQLRTLGNGDEVQLIGATFGGWDKDVMITNSGAATTGNN